MVGYIDAIIQIAFVLRTGFANTESSPYRRLLALNGIVTDGLIATLPPLFSSAFKRRTTSQNYRLLPGINGLPYRPTVSLGAPPG
jgi:hypothetical protein